jgi:hypothetical protein
MQKFGFVLGLLLTLAGALDAAPNLTLQNNQPYPWRLPVRVHGMTIEGNGTQRLGDDTLFVADMPASGLGKISPQPAPFFIIGGGHPEVQLSYGGAVLGYLCWGLDLHPATTNRAETNAAFSPLPVQFQETAHGPVFHQWQGAVTNSGLEIQIELLAYQGGFLDINVHLTNLYADPKIKTYAAVVCRWETGGALTLCYDNRIRDLRAEDQSPFREGEGSQRFMQHGVDWVRCGFKTGATAAWMNDFAPSFTMVDNSTNNIFHAPRYALANLSQIGREARTSGDNVYLISEISRNLADTFRNLLTEDVLPARGEGISFSSRLVFGGADLDNSKVDHAFVAYAGYTAQHKTSDGVTVSYGTPCTRFGTSYFPYSTLGENFDSWKLPGMDRESFWPLAADTVLQWRLFADDIRRDLRIAKAMGFQLIRLHHIELLAGIPPETRREYLDFFFGQLRELHLRALLDAYASPAQLAELVGRYRDLVDGVEIENEILIWGIPLDRPREWKADYAAIKKVAPEVLVSFAGYNNTGMFNRLEELGVPFDRMDLHSYIDRLDSIPSGRGFALALGNQASKLGKPAMISEWNWRGLTRMSEEERAKIYPAIIDNALSTRALTEFYEFQFNETMAPNPRVGRGNLLRHYELVDLSRRPKLETFEFMKLIERYSAPTDSVRIIQSSHEVAELDERNFARLTISITNAGTETLHLHASPETAEPLKIKFSAPKFALAPGQWAALTMDVSLAKRVPGFYHVFVRLESDEGLLRYLWAEVRVPDGPEMDTITVSSIVYPRGVAKELEWNFSRVPMTVAYDPKATVLEVETAFAIGQTLESATGTVVPIMPLSEVPPESRTHLILVGSVKDAAIRALQKDQPFGSKSFVTRVVTPAVSSTEDWLIVGGSDSRGVEDAGMDLLLRYWKFAKDSATRRVGLAQKNLPRGGDATKLP